jgi:hypothetical protein
MIRTVLEPDVQLAINPTLLILRVADDPTRAIGGTSYNAVPRSLMSVFRPGFSDYFQISAQRQVADAISANNYLRCEA